MDGTSRIDELEQKFIENPRRYFAPLANEYRKAGNPHQAIAICRAHLGQLPGHMSGQIVYGQSLFEGGEYDQARTVFENALAMDRENLVALRHLGDLSLRDGETAAARQWYAKLLEVDPRDGAVIALVNELDAAAEAKESSTDSEAVPAAIVEAAAGDPQPVPTAAEPDHTQSDEEDRLLAEELGVPLPHPHAFVTETMAELYLAQGFQDRAVSVYRQLVALRPDDTRLRVRLAEVEHPGESVVEASRNEEPAAAAESSPEETPFEQDEQAVEFPAAEPDVIRVSSLESPGPSVPEIQLPSAEAHLPVDVEMGVDAFESPASEPDSIELPEIDAPKAEPEGMVAPLTVGEFFAGLGRRRPSSRASANPSNGSNDSSGGDGLGRDSHGASDAMAAAALAGAFDGGNSGSATAIAPSPSAPGKESEEDVASFRAWLDGLTA